MTDSELLGVYRASETQFTGILESAKLEITAQIVEGGPKGEKGDDGYTPIKGVDYFDGEQGPKGDDGPRGEQGEQGIQGIQGPKGDDGYTPVKGIDYFDGEQGEQGIQGPKGDKGDTGEQGEQGIQGPKGDKGDPGEQGEQGIQGPKGNDGYTPVKGIDYFDGEQGPKGDKGDTGEQGEQGIQGPKGDKGDPGEQGPKGDKGDKGDTGEIENLTNGMITDALGYIPLSEDSLPDNLETTSGAQAKANAAESNAKDYVDGKVLTDVPVGAKFTDTNTVTTINNKTGAISKADIVALGIPAQDTVYSHPSSHPASMITESSTKRFVTDIEKGKLNKFTEENGELYYSNEKLSNQMPTVSISYVNLTDFIGLPKLSTLPTHSKFLWEVTGSSGDVIGFILGIRNGDESLWLYDPIYSGILDYDIFKGHTGLKFTFYSSGDGIVADILDILSYDAVINSLGYIPASQYELGGKVDNSRVLTDVPENAKFTDTNTVTTVNGKTGAITKADIVALGIPAQDTVYTHPGSGTNPHGTTKANVGLGSVQNYGIATQAEAESGTSNAKYSTPLRVKQAIDANKEIVESGSNPNGSYIKFDDGTMIITTLVHGEAGSTEISNTQAPLPISIPSQFADSAACSLGGVLVYSAGTNTLITRRPILKYILYVSSSNSVWVEVTTEDISSAREMGVTVMVITRWK